MPRRLPACDPCRFSKIACDHRRPVCTRCSDLAQADSCAYRDRPFKKRQQRQRHDRQNLSFSNPAQTQVNTSLSNYPNPGYLGSSSHATIFDHLPPDDNSPRSHRDHRDHSQISRLDDTDVSRGARFITQCCNDLSIATCVNLVEAWIVKGVNLAVAQPFTKQCVLTAEDLLTSCNRATEKVGDVSSRLFIESLSALHVDSTTDINGFCAQFCKEKARWETLGIFFTAISRATVDLESFTPLYQTKKERMQLQKLAMQYSDQMLDLALSLDCLNDLQLVLQYENWILHSLVDGDQSYHSWRRLGDVISSLFALGYHERVDNKTSTPAFLKDLRRCVYALTCSGDKNISIFLGRPPRMHRMYCQFQLPGPVTENTKESRQLGLQILPQWDENASFDLVADARWTALCALLKENAMDLLREQNQDERQRRASIIQNEMEDQYLALPQQFRLDAPLKTYDRTPVERDFLVGTILDYLHVLFLLRLALVRRMPEPDNQLVTVSARILSVVVEAVVLKDHLAYSGTGLIWKVAYYGLPAAGILCLSLLNKSFIGNQHASVSKVVQDLSVLVAEVDTGSLMHIADPNYALVSGATQIIKSILDRLMSSGLAMATYPEHNHSNPRTVASECWDPWAGHNLQDFEVDFWINLAEHPFLNVAEDQVPGFL